jgi:hypothetical protein
MLALPTSSGPGPYVGATAWLRTREYAAVVEFWPPVSGPPLRGYVPAVEWAIIADEGSRAWLTLGRTEAGQA